MNALGRHLLLELRECNPARLDDIGLIQDTLLSAASQAGATVINHIFHQFSPQGVTGVIAISESHLCIHTWPEHGYAAMDIFTCSESFDPARVVQFMVERMESKDPEVLEVSRGLVKEPTPLRRL